MAFFNQLRDHVDHPADLLRGLRMCGRRLYVHGSHVFFAFFDIAGSNFLRRYALFLRRLYDLVIHIRKIGDIVHLESLVLQIAAERVKHDHRPGIADMDQVVHRRPAHVHTDFSGFDRTKFLLCHRQ